MAASRALHQDQDNPLNKIFKDKSPFAKAAPNRRNQNLHIKRHDDAFIVFNSSLRKTEMIKYPAVQNVQ